MFKAARWRSEKNKIKAVFRLQFHATGVSQVGGDSLVISLIPADVGKPTARSEKATIQDGSCYWEQPVYESLKFFMEPKTGKFHEKTYYFLVSNGLSKAGLVGEVSIDFAIYAEAFKVSYVSLPLKNAKSDAILHVSIQRFQENVDESETEDVENAKNNSNDKSLKQLSRGDADGSIQGCSTCSENGPFNNEFSHPAETKRNHWESIESDLTVSSSESSSGLDTPTEFGRKTNLVQQDPTSVLSTIDSLSKTTSNLSTPILEENPTPQWEWASNSAPEISTDDSSSSPPDVLSIDKSNEASHVVIDKLRLELASLSRQAEVSELELQTLRKQMVKESKRGQDLFREVISLKMERNALKAECEKAKSRSNFKFDKGDPRALIEELRQEVNHEKELNTNLRVQLMKMQESNSELILAVRDLDEMLEQKNTEILNLSNSSKYEAEGDEDKKITNLYSELDMYRRDKEDIEVQIEQLVLDNEILKQETHDLSYKLRQSEVQEQLKIQYECSSSYATINELEMQIENLESELKKQTDKYSESLSTIAKLEEYVKSLEEDLEKQAVGFEADLEFLSHAKVEQEKRAILAEETLRKMRWQNANAVDRIHEEFRRLSVEMTSTLEANEKHNAKARTEASELRVEKNHLEKLLQETKEDLQSIREQYEAKVSDLSSQLSLKVNQTEQMQSEIEDKSKQLEDAKRHGEERNMILSEEILVIRAETETLKVENNNLFIEAEENQALKVGLEEINASMREMKMLLGRRNTEKNEMEREIVSLREEAEKSGIELNFLKKGMAEKETAIENLQLELETLKSQHSKFKKSLSKDECEKENLKDRIKVLERQTKLKEDALVMSTNSFLAKEKELEDKIEELERRLEDLNENSPRFCEYESQKVAKDFISSDGNTCKILNITVGNLSTEAHIASENGKSETSSGKEMEASVLNTRDQDDIGELLKEMALLKERNKSMECELKEMQERYSEISLRLAEVEGERQQLLMRARNRKNAKKS